MPNNAILQEYFDKTCKHLFKQGQRALNEHNSCLYLTPSGLKCAVGCHIPASEYVAGHV